jgi:hypothetical protein
MAARTKVFDVAKPGSSKPETGSKPMVVGHKNQLDPTLKGPVESESASTEPMAARTEKKLTPMADSKSEKTSQVADEKKEAVIASDEKIETPAASTEEPAVEPIAETTPAVDAEPERAAPEETPEQKQKAEDDLEIARSEKLQEMIKNKTYNAPIREASMSSVQTFFKTFTVVAVVGIIILIVLIDAEILDLGVNLPFNFL